MIKRQFYKQDHDNDKDDISDSSSDSESEKEVSEAQQEEEQEEDEDSDVASEAKEDEQPSSLSTGSGYNSEESSPDEVDSDSSGPLLNDDEEGDDEEEDEEESSKKYSQSMSKRKFEPVKKSNSGTKDPTDALLAMRGLKCRSVFKCRLCPKIVCLSEETMKAHLTSKRHARSEKLLTEGRLKFMLNSDGEAEEEPETHAERHARTLAIAQDLTSKGSCPTSKKKNRRSLRERKRLKRKEKGNVFDKENDEQLVEKQAIEKGKQSVKKQAKKRRKNKE